jgi:chemotaxis methyl-accepting protein methylase
MHAAAKARDLPLPLNEVQREFAHFFLSYHILDKAHISSKHKIGWASYVARTHGHWHEGYEISGVYSDKNSYVIDLRSGGSLHVTFDAIEKAARLVNSKVQRPLSFFPAPESGRVIFDHLSLNTVPELVGGEYRCNGISNQSYWDRDTGVLKFLGRCILPSWKLTRPMSVASVGCSIGVEPTSLLLLNWEQRDRLSFTGYEIHYDALDAARKGEFRIWTVDSAREKEFFTELPPQTQSEALRWNPADNEHKLLCLTPEAKNAIAYVQHDILAEPLPILHDVIYLRYVMMHFSRKGKITCIENIAKSLHPGGLVILNTPQDGKDGEETRAQTIRLFEKAGFINQTFAGRGGEFHWYDGQLALKKPE